MRVAQSIAVTFDPGRLLWFINRTGYLLVLLVSMVLWVGLISGVERLRVSMSPEPSHVVVDHADPDKEMAMRGFAGFERARPDNLSSVNVDVNEDHLQVLSRPKAYTVSRVTGSVIAKIE